MDIEERQIADVLEGTTPPETSSSLIGHTNAAQEFVDAHISGRLHHAWMITGPKGIGKATLAFRLTAHLLLHPDANAAPSELAPFDAEQPVFRQLANGAHPNVLHLARPYDAKTKKFKTTLAVEEVRRSNRFFNQTAGGGGWRIAIIDTADDMNASAANAILKILEEPPKRSIFFVLASATRSVLPTIRSRCRLLPLKPLPKRDLITALHTQNIGKDLSDDEAALVAELSDGSVRQAMQLVMGQGLQIHTLVEDALGRKSPDWTQLHAIADKVSLRGKDDEYRLFLDIIQRHISKQIQLTDDEPEPSIDTLARWAKVWEKTVHSIDISEGFNLDRKQLVLSIFQSIFEAAKKSH